MLKFAEFKFCSSCGSEKIEQNTEKSIECKSCGFVYFHNVSPAVGAIIKKHGKLLLCKRAWEPQRGMLDTPGGFVDYSETLEEALKREIMEELNLDIFNISYFASFTNEYHYKDVIYPTIDIFFTCEVENFEKIKAADDVQDYVWIEIDKIDLDKIAFPSIKKVIKLLRGF